MNIVDEQKGYIGGEDTVGDKTGNRLGIETKSSRDGTESVGAEFADSAPSSTNKGGTR